jgi:hypothetical protein
MGVRVRRKAYGRAESADVRDENDDYNESRSGDVVTRPDPTREVTRQLLREIGTVRELFSGQFNAVHKEIDLLRDYSENRGVDIREFGANQKELFHEKLQRNWDSVKHLAELTDTQLKSIVTLIEKTAELNNTALQAAFATAEKAVVAAQTASALANTKMETTFTGNFQQINQLITTLQESFRREIGDLRKVQDDKSEEIKKQVSAAESRFQTNEGQRLGIKEYRTEGRLSSSAIAGWIFGSIMGVVGLSGLLFTILTHH